VSATRDLELRVQELIRAEIRTGEAVLALVGVVRELVDLQRPPQVHTVYRTWLDASFVEDPEPGRHDHEAPCGFCSAAAGTCCVHCAGAQTADGATIYTRSRTQPTTTPAPPDPGVKQGYRIRGRVVDPDCRSRKHSSCVGGPCECECHIVAGQAGL
jgi:hypothetical protein